MPRKQIDPQQLATIQKALIEHPEESIRGAHSTMKYKRRPRVESGTLVLQARRKKFATEADASLGGGFGMTIAPEMEPATPEEIAEIEAAMLSLNGSTLLKMLTGAVDYYGIIRKSLETILADNNTTEVQ